MEALRRFDRLWYAHADVAAGGARSTGRVAPPTCDQAGFGRQFPCDVPGRLLGRSARLAFRESDLLGEDDVGRGAMHVVSPAFQALGLAMPIAKKPAFLCDASLREMDWSLGHVGPLWPWASLPFVSW